MHVGRPRSALRSVVRAVRGWGWDQLAPAFAAALAARHASGWHSRAHALRGGLAMGLLTRKYKPVAVSLSMPSLEYEILLDMWFSASGRTAYR